MPRELDPKILEHLVGKLGLAKQTIRNKISAIRRTNPSLPINAAAHVLAVQHGQTVFRMLEKEEKESIANIQLEKAPIKVKEKTVRKKPEKKPLIQYETNDPFIRGHLDEFNRAYNNGVLTAAQILARKIIENLIREILSNKYPSTNVENRELYYDTHQRRFKDFSVILKNLRVKRHDFGPEKEKMISRLYDLAKEFKDGSNDATHSWYYLIKRKKELDDLNIPVMLDLIKKINE